jgi:hypothetical protein
MKRESDIRVSQEGQLLRLTKDIGSLRRARTADPMINSHLLYQLSYQGIESNCIDLIRVRQ